MMIATRRQERAAVSARSALLYLAFLGVTICIAPPAKAGLVVDFEDVALPRGATQFSPATSRGFLFTNVGGNFGFENGYDGPDNGTTHFFASSTTAGTTPATMSRVDGGLFSLVSFDAGEDFEDPISGSFARNLRVVGYLTGGGTVEAHFDIDGIYDALGGVDDFQTFTLTGFVNLTHVEFIGSGAPGGVPIDVANNNFTLDNLVVGVVPEPSTLTMGGIATLLVLGYARRRQRKARKHGKGGHDIALFGPNPSLQRTRPAM